MSKSGEFPGKMSVALLPSSAALIGSTDLATYRLNVLPSLSGARNTNVLADAAGEVRRLGTGASALASTFGTTFAPIAETSSVAYIPQPVTSSEGTEARNWHTVIPREKSLEERLFESLAEVKVLTSKIAMHLDRKWRDQLFAQLDGMHSAAEWDEDDELLSAASFETFLRCWFMLRPERNPGFGISVRGNLLASWKAVGRLLTLEFFPEDRVSWVVNLQSKASVETACGQTPLAKLQSRLAPYEPQLWFTREAANSEH